MLPYRIFGAVIGWLILLFAYGVNVKEYGLGGGTLGFFLPFGGLVSILAVAALTVPLLPANRASAFFDRPGVRTAIAAYLLLLVFMYFFLIGGSDGPRGFEAIADMSMYYGIPAVFLLDWVAFVFKEELPFRAILSWLIFPGVYHVCTAIFGAISGVYPYWFLDVGQMGYVLVELIAVGLGLLLLAVSAALVMAGRERLV